MNMLLDIGYTTMNKRGEIASFMKYKPQGI